MGGSSAALIKPQACFYEAITSTLPNLSFGEKEIGLEVCIIKESCMEISWNIIFQLSHIIRDDYDLISS